MHLISFFVLHSQEMLIYFNGLVTEMGLAIFLSID